MVLPLGKTFVYYYRFLTVDQTKIWVLIPREFFRPLLGLWGVTGLKYPLVNSLPYFLTLQKRKKRKKHLTVSDPIHWEDGLCYSVISVWLCYSLVGSLCSAFLSTVLAEKIVEHWHHHHSVSDWKVTVFSLMISAHALISDLPLDPSPSPSNKGPHHFLK